MSGSKDVSSHVVSRAFDGGLPLDVTQMGASLDDTDFFHYASCVDTEVVLRASCVHWYGGPR